MSTEHKTVSVKVVMETDLILTVNVPKDWDDDKIYEWACNEDGSSFVEDGDGSWYVSPDVIHENYDPNVVTAKEAS